MNGCKTRLSKLSMFLARSIRPTSSLRKCVIARTSDASETPLCPVSLISCLTQSLLFITPPNVLPRLSLQPPHPSVPVESFQVISLLLAPLHFSAPWRISLTYAVLVDIYFDELMALFQLTFSETFFFMFHPKIFPWESTFSFFFFCWTQGWGVLVCPWSGLVERVEVN